MTAVIEGVGDHEEHYVCDSEIDQVPAAESHLRSLPEFRWPFRKSLQGARYDALVADLNQLAARLVKQATDPDEPTETAAQTNGRIGGLKGGKARAKRLSAEERSEIARKAAQARWKHPQTPGA